MFFIRPSRVLLPIVFLALSCSDPSGPRIPASVVVVSGGGQAAAVATVLPQPIVVEVKDASDNLVRGATVTWAVSSGGGTLSAATTTTDGSGRAQVQWTLGTVAGQNRVTAVVTDVPPVTVTAVGQPGAPATAVIVTGTGQSGIAAEPLPGALTIQVRDAHANGVPGVTVTFQANDGAANPASAATSAIGAAQTVWTLGPASGDQTLDANVAGITTPVRFTATAAALDDITELGSGVPVPDISAPLNALLYYRINVPVGAARLEVTTTGADGQDADLFLRHDLIPSVEQFHCSSTTPETTEECVIPTPMPGNWYVMLHAFTPYSDVTLRATYIVGGSLALGVAGLPQGAPAGIVVSGPNFMQTLTGAQTLTGIDPGTYTVTAAHVLHENVVYVANPESQNVNVAASVVTNATVAYGESSGGLDLDITNAYITQAVQRSNGSIPLVAGRDGLLRVFARGNAINTATPAVRARFFRNGAEVESFTIAAPAASVPVSHDEGVLTSTWNVVVPGSLIQPGLSVQVDVDPSNAITETDETDNVYPANAALDLDVRSASIMQARFVPVVQSGNSLQGDVTAANVDQFISVANALYPFPGIDADVHAPYTFTGTLPPDYGSNSPWHDLLNQMRLLRIAEGSTRYYYGVIKPGYTQGGTGLGYIGLPVAIGIDHTFPNHASETVAHEWGHNFGRRHVDCGGPASPDPNYPYNGGRIGHHGWDMRSGSIRALGSHFDLMSYCNPTWSSDYTYEAVLAFRAAEGAPAGTVQPSLLVWGSITPEGVVLEPSFEVVTRPVMPKRGGRYRLTGSNASGKAFEISFDGIEIDHAPGIRHFAYAIPLNTMKGGAPTQLRLEAEGAEVVRGSTLASIAAGPPPEPRVLRAGGRMRIEWDAARSPVVLVRDARTGQVLSFARGGVANIATNAAEVEINMSDGVRSSIRTVAVPR